MHAITFGCKKGIQRSHGQTWLELIVFDYIKLLLYLKGNAIPVLLWKTKTKILLFHLPDFKKKYNEKIHCWNEGVFERLLFWLFWQK